MGIESVTSRAIAFRLILVLGVVSLLGDIVYEGGRSVTGPYLLLLGASALTVAIVSGLGEFLGYGIRLLSGYISDRTGMYWALTIVGYLMVGAVPLLVLAGTWEVAAIFILVERVGKGLRSPARDAILSHASKQVGRGWGFGIHEALDQVGAVIGPLLFAVSIAFSGRYETGFALLAIPFVLLVAALLYARFSVPDPVKFEDDSRAISGDGTLQVSRVMRPYGAFTVLTMAGFAVFPLMAYHFSAASVVPEAQVPVFYAIAMATDALFALAMGRVYDRVGLSVLVAVPVINIPIAALAFMGGYTGALAASILWGLSMGGQETVLRAALADLTSVGKRGTAYGVFNTLYGGAWFAGSVVMGALYGLNLALLVLYCIVMQAGALAAFVWLRRTVETGRIERAGG
ncbi:MAG: MFS transporter [Methanolinea sp.]|jgi:MFS family permease|nr:MFS transporter [Methanolinea sp.]